MTEPVYEWHSRHVAPYELVTLGDTTARLSDWAQAVNVSSDTLRSRMRGGDMVWQALRPERAGRASVALRYEHDPGAMQFVEEHEGGAERNDVAAFFGLSPERVRQIEESGLRKMRTAMGADEAPKVERKSDRARVLVAQGVPVPAIVQRVGLNPRSVYGLIQEHRRAS